MGAILSTVQTYIEKYGAKKVVAAVFALALLKSTIGTKLMYKLKNLPPGPMPLPIIGTLYQMSQPNTPPGIHKDFYRMFEQYGGIYSLWFGAHYGVVLNTPDLWFEALKEKQDDFAHRPTLKSFEAITHGQGVAMNNGPRWRMIRTVLQQYMTNKQKGVEAEPDIMEEVCSSLKWFRDEISAGRGQEVDLRLMAKKESLNLMMRKIFSLRFGKKQSKEYYDCQDWIRIIFEHMMQGSPSDFIPIAAYLPNNEEALYRKTCLRMESFIDGEIEKHRAVFPDKPQSEYDFIDNMFLAQNEAKKTGAPTLTDVDIRVCAWDMMAGGIDTSATSMEWLIYILINHKPVLQKLHKILDEVVGDDRLPCLDDIPQLEYLTAILDELFRWKHFAPQGLPHEAAVDSTLGGYNIPKGTQIFFNFYSLHHNPKLWKKPEEFRPERFMEEERFLLETCLHAEKTFTKKEAYKFVPFGQGRRRCVGYGIGRIAMWLKAAVWLHCFDWDTVDGKPLDIDTEYLGITLIPINQSKRVKATPRPAARILTSISGKYPDER